MAEVGGSLFFSQRGWWLRGTGVGTHDISDDDFSAICFGGLSC